VRRLLLVFSTVVVCALAGAAAAAAEGTYTGRVVVRHADLEGQGRAKEVVLLETARAGRLRIDDRELRAFAGSTVKLRATRRGETLYDGDVVARNHDPTLTPNQSRGLGERKYLVLLASTGADVAKRWNPAQTHQLMFGSGHTVSDYFRAQSHGQAWLAGDTRGWYTIDSYGEGPCDYGMIAAKALEEAKAAGVVIGDYHHVMISFPRRDCGWNGMAEIGGDFAYINGHVTDMRLLAHEVGHNFGVHHASSLSCRAGGATVAFSDDCTRSEYGDPLDVMGHASRNLFNNVHRARIGWFAPSQIATVTRDAVHDLRSVNAAGGGTKLVQVRRPGDVHQYFGPRYFALELRTPLAPFDAFAPDDSAVSGVGVRMIWAWNWALQTHAVDLTPGSPYGHRDGHLRPGQSFTDAATRTVIEVLSIQAGVARVRVRYVPSAPAGLTAALDGEDAAALAWQASVDESGVTGYEIERDGAVVARTTALRHRDAGLPGGHAITYRVFALDGDGNRVPSAPATVVTPPPPPPERPVLSRSPDVTRPTLRLVPGVPARGRRVPRSRKLVLYGVDDRSAVRLEVRLDGRLVRAANGARYLTFRVRRRALRGTHRLELRVVDASGNRRALKLRIVRGVLRPVRARG
jgi:hypothetical protein